MKKRLLRNIACSAIVIGASLTSANGQATLISQFDFNGNLSDQQGNSTCTSYNNLATSYASGEFVWAGDSTQNGGGLTISVPDAVFTENNYSIAIDFSFSQVSGYMKIVDYSGLTADAGLYVNDQLRLYSSGGYGPTTWSPNTNYTVVITRNSADDSTKAYLFVNSQLQVESAADDITGAFVATLSGSDRILEFFHDDTVTVSEFSPSGTVNQIRIWNGIVSAADVITGVSQPEGTLAAMAYPVPANNSLTVSLGAISSGSYSVYSAQGSVIAGSNFSAQSELEIQTDTWAEGIYYLHVTSETGSSVVPVVISR